MDKERIPIVKKNKEKPESQSSQQAKQGTQYTPTNSVHPIHQKLKNRFKRNITLNTISIVLALIGIGWALHYFWRYSTHEITNDAIIDQYIAPINIRVSGYLKDVRFIEHQYVNAGDTLVILEDDEYKIKVMDAEAALMDAEAAAAASSSGVKTSQQNISVSEANIAETKVRLWQLQQDEKRYANLLAEKSVSQQQYEKVKTEAEAMKARYEALLAQKQSAEFTSSEIEARKESAEALILRKQADLDMAKLNLSYTVVMAPYEGHMGRRTLEKGQYVQAGQTLSYIIRGNEKWITANYLETQISNIHIGQEVNIKVDAFKGKVFKGKVTAISEATGSRYSLVPTDISTGNFVKIQQRIPVRIDFEDISQEDLNKLRVGMMVETEAKLK